MIRRHFGLPAFAGGDVTWAAGGDVSLMIWLQSTTHSSHMNTAGPAISRRTLSWVLPQNEHLASTRFGTERVYFRFCVA